jgi:predicted PurR-regulated permease PerM
MFSLDDRTGNAVTTVAVFILVATILYLARGALLILFLSLLFAYLLDPEVTSLQRHSRLAPPDESR